MGGIFCSIAVVWVAGYCFTRWVLRRSLADAGCIMMSASYGNVVMLGIPLAILALGPSAAAPAAVIISIHSPILWIVASIYMVWAQRSGASPARLARQLLVDLARNIIILSILAGSLWRITGFGLHPTVAGIAQLLGQAAVPCALISLGLSLVGIQIKGQLATLGVILCLKNIAMPLLAWLFAYHLFDLPPLEAGVVILFAAMPTGANAYLFAARYARVVNSTSAAVALGTAISAGSAALIIFLLIRP